MCKDGEEMSVKQTVQEVADAIVCPYCNHWHDYDEWVEVGDMSGEFAMECNSCSNTFKVEFYSVYYFTATDKGERSNG